MKAKSSKSEPKVPPQNLDAEMSCLGCQMLVEADGNRSIPRQLERLSDILTIEDYASWANQMIQGAIWSCRDRNGGNCDIVLVAEELQRVDKLDEVGGPSYLNEILETVPHSGHLLHYAEIIARHSRRRRIHEIGRKLVRYAENESIDDKRLVEAATKALARIAFISEKEVSDYSI